VEKTIFKAQVYNGCEKTRVKQHKRLWGFLSVLKKTPAILKCAWCVIFACIKHETISKQNRKLRGLLLAILKTQKPSLIH